MRFQRSCGLLLHISSLPGELGIGDAGPSARWFVDFLRDAGQSWWQILPLGPTDDGNPYIAQSSWAGAPHLVSLQDLADTGDLRHEELRERFETTQCLVDYRRIAEAHGELLTRAAERFFDRRSNHERERFDLFCEAEASWLEDWATFAAVRRHHGGQPWWAWPRDLALREPEALVQWRIRLDEAIQRERYIQFRFFEQWARVRGLAADAGVRLIGDVPFYCARDSADVWAARDRFLLDERGHPNVVSGVPPDYFAEDGQLWGTPIYDWPRHEEEDYAWWIGRLRGILRMVDVVRVDHFRAFDSYWEVPADAATARTGRWCPGPGDGFFAATRAALGEAPLIAEDLGIITAEVDELRRRWDLPGMKVLQFAFGQGGTSPHLPVYHEANSVVYSGTHDNDTSVGWYRHASEEERDHFRRFTASDGGSPHYHMMLTAHRSVADLAIVPVQDVLGLDSDARTNVPGVATGNWRWRLLPGQLDPGASAMLREMAGICGRLPGQGVARFVSV